MMGERKIIKRGLDQDSKLSDAGRMTVEIIHRQIQVIFEKQAYEELDDKEVGKLQRLVGMLQSQQKHAIDLEKLQNEKPKGEEHKHIHLDAEAIAALTSGENSYKIKESLKTIARGANNDTRTGD